MRMNENIEKVSTAFSFYQFIAENLNLTAFLRKFKIINFHRISSLLLHGEIIFKQNYTFGMNLTTLFSARI